MSIKGTNVLKKVFPYLIFMAVILLVLSYQIRTHTTIFVSDGYFHFSRFYDAAQQIKTHNFSYFQTNWGFDQSGRIINALYGPYFAYLMGLILLICGTWFRFQIVVTFLISFVAAVGIYRCLNRVSVNIKVNMILTLIYITTINLWSNGSTFNAVSSAMVPYVLYCGLGMIQNKDCPINWIQLSLVMSIVAQVHVLSTILFAILLVPFFVIGFVQNSSKKQMVVSLLKAVVLTLILTINIWSSLLYFHSAEMVSNPIATNMVKSTISVKRFTILSMFLMLVQFIYVLCHFKQSKINTVVTVLALVFLIMATKLFPWGVIQAWFPVLKEAFQMPRRLFILIVPLYIVGVGITVNNLGYKNEFSRFVVYALLGLVFLSNYSRVTRINHFYVVNSLMTATVENRAQRMASNSKDLALLFDHLNVPAPDYLPVTDKQISSKTKVKLYKKQVIKTKSKYQHTVTSGGGLELRWYAPKAKSVILPIVLYKNSRLSLNGKQEHTIKKTAIGAPIVQERVGNNVAILRYESPRWWKYVLYVNWLVWLSFVAYIMYRLFKNSLNENEE